MEDNRFTQLTSKYAGLRVAVVGDFCLDRYLEIDPARRETSIETGLPVHNVVRVRSQPGAAGTILSNLSALGIGTILPLGFAGVDGEGFELRRELAARPGVGLDWFIQTSLRRTFTYCKPLIVEPGRRPIELSRLDSKNWEPTPRAVQARLAKNLRELAEDVDAIILMDQVDQPETGVVTGHLLSVIAELAARRPEQLMLADSRRGLRGYPTVCLKMNTTELNKLTSSRGELTVEAVGQLAVKLARQKDRRVFVTLSERGLLGAAPDGAIEHVGCLPLRGEIDVVGAGDAVTANLTTALAAGASLREAIEIANTAASIVIHQLGTTGTATVKEIRELLEGTR